MKRVERGSREETEVTRGEMNGQRNKSRGDGVMNVCGAVRDRGYGGES